MNTTQPQIPVIKNGAFFIADSHYILTDSKLLSLIKKLISSPPVQVFFMGDIFHLFIGHIPSSQRQNYPLLNAINELSQKTETYYFEGNHDFGFDNHLMPNLRLYPRSLQPALFKWEEKYFLLSHGDIFLTKSYDIYIKTLSNPLSLNILKIIDYISFGLIYKFIAKKINQKPIKQFHIDENNFKIFAKQRFEKYLNFAQKNHLPTINGAIEGHFHIGKNSSYYFSLPSFYCQKCGCIVDNNTIFIKSSE